MNMPKTHNEPKKEPPSPPKDETFSEQPITSPPRGEYDTPIPRRVKLYELKDDKWIDCGTGYCNGRTLPNPHFYVINELNTDEILLKSFIKGSTQYQRQQDTLIVWTNIDNNIDYALSFQESDGCLELCNFLKNLQVNKLTPNISIVSIIQNFDGEITEIIAAPIPELLIPNLDNLNEVLNVLTIHQFKIKLIDQILENNGDWIHKLIEIFKVSESNHLLNNIYCLTDIIKTLFYFNDIEIFELLITEDLIDSILGILEYEPEFPGLKMNWRLFLKNHVKFYEVIKFENSDIKDKIRQVFILNFLKDTVLARFIDDSIFNCISTLIQNKECKILEFLKLDLEFLTKLFMLYDNDQKEPENNELKVQGIKLLNQFILMSKSLPNYQRTEFYKLILDKGLLKMIKFSINESSPDKSSNKIKILITEIILIIIDHDLSIFKNSESNDNNFNIDILIDILINILLNNENIGLKSQSFETLKLLIDPNHDDNFPNNENNDFLFLKFYENSASKLFKPLIELNIESLDKIMNNSNLIMFENLCDLLSFISKFHDPIYSRSFILENHLLKKINDLINSSTLKFKLRLCAIRCLRSIILLNDEFYTRYIIEKDVLSGFIQLFESSKNSNNLINSTCINLLNCIYENLGFSNFKILQKYLCDKYAHILKDNFVGSKLINDKGAGDNHNDDNGNNDDDDNGASGDDTLEIKNDRKRSIDCACSSPTPTPVPAPATTTPTDVDVSKPPEDDPPTVADAGCDRYEKKVKMVRANSLGAELGSE